MVKERRWRGPKSLEPLEGYFLALLVKSTHIRLLNEAKRPHPPQSRLTPEIVGQIHGAMAYMAYRIRSTPSIQDTEDINIVVRAFCPEMEERVDKWVDAHPKEVNQWKARLLRIARQGFTCT